ncbi:hypothetical protein M231_00263 [Tremella mesenterica]|uniref:Uncharacterized protein n=1 Tax=Tremella mesenterica TaxID=5217 RepID=A0A4Q1BVU4_TREME|nr:hypothetical protein M231_00263 [Tremella mesenterica]
MDNFTIDIPRDTSGQPLKDLPPGLFTAVEAFRHAVRLGDISKVLGADDWTVGAGYESIADKLHLAAERTQANSLPTGLMKSTTFDNQPENPDSDGLSRRSSTSDEALFPHRNDNAAKTEWWASCLFWSWQARERGIPNVKDVGEWMKEIRCERDQAEWAQLWAAYCVSQVKSMDEGV